MQPLSDVRVVEFCQGSAGPFCGMLLADLGADVIKVEPPAGGDSLRQWPPFNGPDSENFAALNRNKRSVALDLQRAAGRDAALRLALSGDVVLENFRPGVMKRLGLGWEALSADKPELVYCSISAFGQSGPRAHEPAFDLTLQALAGLMSVTGEADGAPLRCGVPVADFCAGLYAATAVLAAVHQVATGGGGSHIDSAILGATLGVAALQTSEYFGTGRDPQRMGSAQARNAPYQAFRAADGWFAMAAGNDRLWQSVCLATGLPDLYEDSRFGSTRDRAANRAELQALLEARFAQAPVADWVDRLSRAGVPCAPVNGYADALADPQVAHMGWVQALTLPGGGETRTFGPPLRLGGEPLPIRRRPPALGEHTAELLAELGIAPETGA